MHYRPAAYFDAPQLRFFFLCYVVLLLACNTPACAYDDVSILSPSGDTLFVYRIYNKGEFFIGHLGTAEQSTYTLSLEERKGLIEAGAYWAQILGPAARNTSPLYFTVGTNDIDNASASSPVVGDGPYAGFTKVAAGIVGNYAESQGPKKPAGLIYLGLPGKWCYNPTLSQVPNNGDKWPMSGVMAHEIGHALGISSNIGKLMTGESLFISLSKFAEHLYDQTGQVATAYAQIIQHESEREDPEAFLVTPEGAYGGTLYFSGRHVQDVLQGVMLYNPSDPNHTRVPGIPINGWEKTSSSWDDASFEGSHLELINSSMSHQTYRNYSYWMEAELAVLQDIGYSLDRKNFFGYSVYGDSQTITNTNGYFARNAGGTGYLAGVPNTATYGLGLHIYGSNNTITQAADILANGAAGMGIRVDGVGNTMRIAPHVAVRGDGMYGTGLRVTYGKDHTIIHQGNLSAMGQSGIAARFDFGDNLLSNETEYRGSYIRTKGPENARQNLGDLAFYTIDGPLVSRFDVTGSLRGSAAAIAIGPSALVQKINVMRGSILQGDIVSLWDVTNPNIQYTGDKEHLVTTLSFGFAPHADGCVSVDADPHFALRYTGNIAGKNSMRLVIAGGKLVFNGAAELLSLTNHAGASLLGNAVYTLNTDSTFATASGLSGLGLFTNNGMLSPGNSIGTIEVKGNFLQGSSGVLNMEFAANSATDVLHVSGDATLNGTLQLQAAQDYFPSQQNIEFTLNDMLQVGGTSTVVFTGTDFALMSPTLRMTLDVLPADTYRVEVSRAPNAYSQYAGSASQRSLGRALDAIGPHAVGDMQNLFRALDFSAVNGSTIHRAFTQLSPSLYASTGQASLDYARMGNSMAMASLSGMAQPSSGQTLGSSPSPASSQVFLMPFAGALMQKADTAHSRPASHTAFGGFVGVWNKNFSQSAGMPAVAGLSLVYGHRLTRSYALANSKTDALSLGVQGYIQPAILPETVGDFWVQGSARIGVENIKSTRLIALYPATGPYPYHAKNTADFTSFTAGAGFRAGLDKALNQSLTLGIFAGFDYQGYFQPAFHESGSATALHLAAASTHSLRSELGGQLKVFWQASEMVSAQAGLSAFWAHEFMGTGSFHASFAGYPQYTFYAKNTRSRDSLNVMGNLSFSHSASRLALSFFGGVETFRKGYTAVQGGVNLAWKF